ncbi:MAG: SDR family oxidoreductase [Myxococcota bacterium]
MGKNFLVTGGSGFIGGNLTRALVEGGHRVKAFFKPGDNLKPLEGLDVELIEGDICDISRLSRAMKGCEGVFHTAGVVSFRKSDRAVQYRVNVEGVRAVVAACKKAGVKRLVHTSTINTLGIPYPEGSIGDEETEFNWYALGVQYAITKKLGEDAALKANGGDLEVVCVNPGTVFGGGDVNFNAGEYIRASAKGLLLFYPEGGTNCVHISAVVAGHISAFEKGRAGERYILGGENLSYREIFETIADVLGTRKPILKAPYLLTAAISYLAEISSEKEGGKTKLALEAAKAGRYKLFYSSAKAERELGLPAIPFRAAVEDAVEWYRKEGMLR